MGPGFSIAVSSQVSAVALAHLPEGPSRRHHRHGGHLGCHKLSGRSRGQSWAQRWCLTQYRVPEDLLVEVMLGQTPAELRPLESPPNHGPPKFYFCPWLLTGMCVCVPFRTVCPQAAIA